MTTCAGGPALRKRPQTLSRAGTGPETDRQRGVEEVAKGGTPFKGQDGM